MGKAPLYFHTTPTPLSGTGSNQPVGPVDFQKRTREEHSLPKTSLPNPFLALIRANEGSGGIPNSTGTCNPPEPSLPSPQANSEPETRSPWPGRGVAGSGRCQSGATSAKDDQSGRERGEMGFRLWSQDWRAFFF